MYKTAYFILLLKCFGAYQPVFLLTPTLNQDEILQLLSADREDAFRTLLQESLNSVLKAESQEQLQAAPYERSEGRTDSRNGFRTSEPEISKRGS